jgi:hypothetical protein
MLGRQLNRAMVAAPLDRSPSPENLSASTSRNGCMELNRGRLQAALVTARIRPTEETIATLSTGLGTISHGYHIEKLISGEVKTDAEVRKEFSQLRAAFGTAIRILDADMNGTRQIEILLSDRWHRGRIPEFLEDLRSHSSRIEMLLTMIDQNAAIKKRRRRNPETWFFLAIHDLFATISGDPEPGIGGPLHRFTQHCAALTDPRIEVPENENSFRKRLTAALARRTGKISVLPRHGFPGKIATPI